MNKSGTGVLMHQYFLLAIIPIKEYNIKWLILCSDINMREVYMEEKQYSLPSPIVNKKESDALVALTEKYEKMTTPGKLSKAGKKVVEIIPEPVKKVAKTAKDGITEAECFAQCMKVLAEWFGIL